MELEIYNPKEDGFIQSIDFNKDEIKSYISQNLEKYQGLIYDDNSIKLAKTDRATLNNFKTVLDTKRKEIKNKCLEPYNAFESQIKELMALVDQPLLAIDDQVKEYESRKKAEKRDQAMEIYNEIFEEFQEVISFNSIEDKRWQNTTFNIKDVRSDIEGIYSNIQTGVKIIKDKNSEFETTLLDVFFSTRDLDMVLRKEESLKKAKEAMQEAERLKAEKVNTQPVYAKPVHTKPVEPLRNTISAEPIETVNTDDGRWYNFSLFMTQENVNELKEWIKENKIEIRKLGE
ncbi:MAG: hypothetical protein FD141_384 [Fusobacteria bacterium]|nr:MAG: hypothetical protein FD141_384 [Fusobacteriota bacterium]KAF0228951.1 MAG: hypothetical protein FD182_1207 [Fusobacteriota bacterium]